MKDDDGYQAYLDRQKPKKVAPDDMYDAVRDGYDGLTDVVERDERWTGRHGLGWCR